MRDDDYRNAIKAKLAEFGIYPADDFDIMAHALGDAEAQWPLLERRRPRWWQLRLRRDERRLLAAVKPLGIESFTPDMREAFRREWNVGQATDDAGGFIWRCWEAALRAHVADDYEMQGFVPGLAGTAGRR